MEQLEDAERDFSAAVEIDSNNPAPYVNRGGVLYLLGQTNAALADFQRYLDQDPEDNLGMHDAVRSHITLCAPPDDLAGDMESAQDEAVSDGESNSDTSSDTEGDEESPLTRQSLRGGRSIPQRSTGPTDEWLNSTNIPRPQRWERRRVEGPQPPRGGSNMEVSLLRVSSEVSKRWYKQAGVCGGLAVVVIVALLIFAFV
jgi:tetratricopeptide (TPR) repeat protein